MASDSDFVVRTVACHEKPVILLWVRPAAAIQDEIAGQDDLVHRHEGPDELGRLLCEDPLSPRTWPLKGTKRTASCLACIVHGAPSTPVQKRCVLA